MPPNQPQSNLPIFVGDTVRFANTTTFIDVYKKSLGRGAVAVFSDATLEPLQPFDVQITIAGEPKEVSATVQVVSKRPGMYLLQLLDGEGTVKQSLAELVQNIQDKLSGDLLENLMERARVHATTSPKARQGPLPNKRRMPAGPRSVNIEIPGGPDQAPPPTPFAPPTPIPADGPMLSPPPTPFSPPTPVPAAAPVLAPPTPMAAPTLAPPPGAPGAKPAPAPISLGVSAPEVPIATDEPPPAPAVDGRLQVPKGNIADAIGMDFGQAFSGIAIGVDEAVFMVPDDSGHRIFPTAIYYADDGPPEVAWQARQRRGADPRRTISSIKRLLGRDFSDPLIAGFLHSAPYQTKLGTGDRIDVVIDDQRRSVPQICGDIMAYLRTRVAARLDRSVDKVVLTHPVAFSDKQKEALKDAAELAGFEVIGMLDEPVAVALAYGLGKGKDERVAVYDFGGGTFDFTILDLSGDDYKVVSRAGDAWLGGDDFDLALAQALGNIFWRQTKVELQNRAVEWQRLLHACENAKRLLSLHEEAELLLKQLVTSPEPIDFQQRIDRAGFQRIGVGLFGQTLGLCQDALDDAGLKASDINQLIISGGTSRIPFVREGLANLFGQPAAFVVNPEEAVTLGAGIEAARLSGHGARRAWGSEAGD